jgi:hypothetical protein
VEGDLTKTGIAPAAGLLKTLIARGGAFTFSFFLDGLELAAAGADVPKPHWQEAAGRRLLTPQEFAARQRYFDAQAELALSRLGRP